MVGWFVSVQICWRDVLYMGHEGCGVSTPLIKVFEALSHHSVNVSEPNNNTGRHYTVEPEFRAWGAKLKNAGLLGPKPMNGLAQSFSGYQYHFLR